MITAHLNYLGSMDEKPMFHVFDSSRHNLNLVPHPVVVQDGRQAAGNASLESEGFCLVRHRTSVIQLESRKEVLRTYRPEIEKLIGELTGALQVVAEPVGVVRVTEPGKRPPQTPAHAPVRFVHTDFTRKSASWLIHRMCHATVAELIGQGRRCVVYNVWRSLTPAPQDVPLAICDLRTIETEDGVAADAVMDFPGSRSGSTETTLFRFNARHQWYYYPDMTGDEVLIFKSFDSHACSDGWAPHTAFDDPNCHAGAPARASLDLRAVAVF